MIFRPLTQNLGKSGRAGKNGLDIRIQQKKSYQIDEIFFSGFEEYLKMQASVICQKLKAELMLFQRLCFFTYPIDMYLIKLEGKNFFFYKIGFSLHLSRNVPIVIFVH